MCGVKQQLSRICYVIRTAGTICVSFLLIVCDWARVMYVYNIYIGHGYNTWGGFVLKF